MSRWRHRKGGHYRLLAAGTHTGAEPWTEGQASPDAPAPVQGSVQPGEAYLLYGRVSPSGTGPAWIRSQANFSDPGRFTSWRETPMFQVTHHHIVNENTLQRAYDALRAHLTHLEDAPPEQQAQTLLGVGYLQLARWGVARGPEGLGLEPTPALPTVVVTLNSEGRLSLDASDLPLQVIEADSHCNEDDHNAHWPPAEGVEASEEPDTQLSAYATPAAPQAVSDWIHSAHEADEEVLVPQHSRLLIPKDPEVMRAMLLTCLDAADVTSAVTRYQTGYPSAEVARAIIDPEDQPETWELLLDYLRSLGPADMTLTCPCDCHSTEIEVERLGSVTARTAPEGTPSEPARLWPDAPDSPATCLMCGYEGPLLMFQSLTLQRPQDA